MHNRLRFALYGALMLFTGFSTALAQGVGSSRGLPDASGGTHVIKGHVFLPNGRSVEQGIMVKLESGVIGTRTAGTDSTGTFIFNSLPAAEYTVIVDAGKEYEVLRESVVIYGTSGFGNAAIGTASLLDLHLVPKGGNSDAVMFPGVPKEAIAIYKKAAESARSGNTKKAVEQLNGAIAIFPNFSVAQMDLGTAYLKLGQPDKAAVALSRAVELQPKDFTSQSNLGFALLNTKSFADAEQHLRAALVINGAAPTAHMYLGIALLNQRTDPKTGQFVPEKYAEAQKEFETAASTGKEEVAQAHKYLGGIYWGNKEYKKAADEFETYLKLNPKAPEAEKLKASIKELRSKG